MQQGKGLIKFFLVVMTLVCIMQYFFLYPTGQVEDDAEAHAQSLADQFPETNQDSVFKAARTAYLDSMSSEEIFSIPMLKSFTYSELKARQLALGLDLKGGMSVVLQVDLREFIKALAKDNQDKTFLNALEQATAAQASAQSDYVSLFADAYEAQNTDVSLAEVFGNNPVLEDDINIETTDDEVIRLIREKANETVQQTFRRLKERIDKLGVTQPNVSLDAGRDLIIVELPGIDNPERAREFLQAAAKLEFWNTYRIDDQGITQGFLAANETLKRVMNYQTAEAAQVI
ncbi:MAG: protein translocase subunit SecDF, partial [Bacteroidota bacterium]